MPIQLRYRSLPDQPCERDERRGPIAGSAYKQRTPVLKWVRFFKTPNRTVRTLQMRHTWGHRPSANIGRVSDGSAQPPTHSEDGVDLTLIRWMLSLTPAERLEVLQSAVDSILEIRERNAQI